MTPSMSRRVFFSGRWGLATRGLGELLAFLDLDATALANQGLLDRRKEVVNDKAEHKSADRSKTIDPALKAQLVREVNERISR